MKQRDFIEFFKKMPGVDPERLAVMGHSLGSEPAMALGVLSDDIKAVVFNDFLSNPADCASLTDPAYQRQLASVIFSALLFSCYKMKHGDLRLIC